MVAPSKPPSFMKGLFDSALGDVMSNIISDLGHELSDDVLNTRATRAFRAFDTDGSGRLEFHELLRAMDTLPHSCRPAREADARALFRRFDTDASGALDADEFTRLVRCLRSRARLDRMPGVIFCGGELMNPGRNPELAARLLYSKPYEPWSALARAIAKPTRSANDGNTGGNEGMSSKDGASAANEMYSESSDDDSDRDDDSALEDPMHTRGGTHIVRGKRQTLPHGSTHSSSTSSRSNTGVERNALARRRRAYFVLLLVRLVACAAPGYVHPDEYHQSVEVAAADVLGYEVTHPWEFTGKSPARSAIAPHLAAGWTYAAWGLVFKILRVAKIQLDEEKIAPAVVFLAPRLGMFLGSLLLDDAVELCARACVVGKKTVRKTAGMDAKLACASSWPVLVLAIRPFSNSLEAVLFAVAAVVTLAKPRWYRWRVSGTLGFIAAIGIWTRFTSALLFAPLALRTLTSALNFRVYPLASSILVTCVGVSTFVATALALVALDTVYYEGGGALVEVLMDPLNAYGQLVAAPYNSLRYNSDVANLASHGLHPRGTHVALNAPMMFGPLVFFAYTAVFGTLFAFAFGKPKAGHEKEKGEKDTEAGADHPGRISLSSLSPHPTQRPQPRTSQSSRSGKSARAARRTLWLVTVLYISGLSLAPHQEPRFLLPLIVPLCSLFGGVALKTPGRRLIWVVFNLVGFAVFGIAHQGGVTRATAAIPTIAANEWHRTFAISNGGTMGGPDAADDLLGSLETASRSTPPKVHAAFWRTYTPPLSLLARESPAEHRWSPGASIGATKPLAAWRRRNKLATTSSGSSNDDDDFSVGIDETVPAFDPKTLPRVHTADLSGLPADGVRYALRHGRCEGSGERGEACVTLLIAPVAAVKSDSHLENVVEEIAAFGPHFSGEEMESYVAAYKREGVRAVWEGMRLGVYRLKESA